MATIESTIFNLGWAADKIETDPSYRSPMWGYEVELMRNAKELLETYCRKYDDHQFTINELLESDENG